MFGGDSGVNIGINAQDHTRAVFASVNSRMGALKGTTSRLGGSLTNLKGTFTSLPGPVGALSSGLSSTMGSVTALGAALGPVGIAAVGAGIALTALGGSAIKAGLEMEHAINTIRVGTGATGAALANLGDSFKTVFTSVPVSMDTAATAIADINTRLNLTGEPLEALAIQFANLSKITGTDISTNIASATRVMTDFSVAAGEQGTALDYLFKVSQSTGIGVSQLSNSMTQYGSVMRQMGFDINESAALLGNFEKSGVNLQLVLGSLRQGLANFAKAGEEPADALQRVTTEIKGMSSTAEANVKAIEVFGARAGPDMAAAIREGRFEIGELITSLDASGETINKAAADTLEFGDKWTLAKNNITEAIAPIGSIITGTLGVAIDTLSAGFGALQTVISSVMDVGTAFHDAVLAPISDALEPLTGAIDALISKTEPGLDVMQLFSDVMTIIAEVAKRVGEAIGNLISTAITPFIDKLTSGADAVGGFIDIFSPLTDLVGGGVGVINEFADGIRNSKDPVDALSESVKTLGETQKQLGEQAEAAAPLTQHAWEKAVSAFKSGTGSLKSALSEVEKEIAVQTDLWVVGGAEAREDIGKTIVSLGKEKVSLETLKSTGEEYIKSALVGNAKIGRATEDSTKTMDAFKVVVGNTTIEFEGMAAEMLKNVDGFSKMEESAQKLMDVNWSGFSDFQEALPDISNGIGKMTDSFGDFKTVISNNTENLRTMKVDMMDVGSEVSFFSSPVFQNSVNKVMEFATTISKVNSAVRTLSNLQEVNIDGAAHFSRSIHSMTTALGLLKGQMASLAPAFDNFHQSTMDIVKSFTYGTDQGQGMIDTVVGIANGIKSRIDLVGDLPDLSEWVAWNKTLGMGRQGYYTFDPNIEIARKRAELGYSGAQFAMLPAIQKFNQAGADAAKQLDLLNDFAGQWERITKVSISAEEANRLLHLSEKDLNAEVEKAISGTKTINHYYEKKINLLKQDGEQLKRLTDSLNPYLTFMRTLNEIAALSIVSEEALAAGFQAVGDSLTNLGTAAGKVDFSGIFETLFAEGSGAANFIEAITDNIGDINILTSSLDLLDKTLSTIFDTLLTFERIDETILLDPAKLSKTFSDIGTGLDNFRNELSVSAEGISEGMKGIFDAFSPLSDIFLDPSGDVEKLNSSLVIFTSTISNIVDTMDLLKELSEATLVSETELAAGFDNAEEAVNRLDSAVVKHIGLIRDVATGKITLNMDSENVFKSIKDFADGWKEITEYMGDSFIIFDEGIEEIQNLADNIKNFAETFKDLGAVIFPTSNEIKEGFKHISEGVAYITTAIGSPSFSAVTTNMQAFKEKWDEVAGTIVEDTKAFAPAIAMLTSFITTSKQLSDAFSNVTPVVVISAEQIKTALAEFPKAIAELTTFLGSDLFKKITADMKAFGEEYAETVTALSSSSSTFSSAVSTITSFITASKQLSDAFTDVTPVVVISAEQIEAAFAELPKAITELTAFLGSNLFKEITADMNAFGKEYAEIVTALSSSSSTFSSAASTITSFITASKQLSDTFTEISPIIAISAGEIEAALAGFPKAINELTKFFTSDTFRVIEDALNGVNTEYKKHKDVLDATLPSFHSAVEAIESLVSKIASLQNALVQLRDTAIMSTRDIDAALKKVPEFLEHFVKALKLNMGSIKRALSDLNSEWSNHAEEMRRVMPAFNDATKQIGDLVSGVLSLSDALTKLSETGTITEAGFDTGFGHLMNTISNFAKSLSRNVSSLMLALRGLEEVYLAHQSTLNPLINNFIAITDNFKMVADNAIDLACAFKALTEDGDSLQSGFEVLTTFIGKVSEVAETFYTPVAAEKIQDFIRDIGHIVNALIDLEIDLTLEVDRIVAIISQLSYPAKHSWQWGADFMGEFINGIYSRFDDLREAMAAAAEIVKDFLGVESPTKLGPLSDLDAWPRNLVHSFSSGIEQELSSINSSFSKLATPAMALTATGGETRGNITLNITQNIANRGDADASADAIKRMLLERQIM